MAAWNKVCIRWKEFCEWTSIHGLIYIYSKPYLSFATKFAWKIIFLSMLALCIYQSALNVFTYLSFKTSTTEIYSQTESFTFPSITFSPMTMFRRSQVGKAKTVPFQLASWYAEGPEQTRKLIPQENESCYYPTSTEWAEKVDKDLLGLIFTLSTANLSKSVSYPYERSIYKCWWSNKEFNCSDGFINHISDVLFSFTFNVGNIMSQHQKEIDIPEAPDVKGFFGLNLNVYKESMYKITSAKQGLRLLMYINQNESCGNDIIKRGAGIIFAVHDANFISWLISYPYSYLTPGYNNNIAIKRVLYKRNVEHLGFCKSKADTWFLQTGGMYNTDLCRVQCGVIKIWQRCSCIMSIAFPMMNVIRQNLDSFLISNVSQLRLCIKPNDFQCQRKVIIAWLNSPPGWFCPSCKVQCVEWMYEIHITKSLMITKGLEKELNMSNHNEIMKNFILANFFIADMNIRVIEISQAFILKDLFVYVGNNIGLFLGMSFFSLFEVMDIVIQTMYILLGKKKIQVVHVQPKFGPTIKLKDVTKHVGIKRIMVRGNKSRTVHS